MGVGGEGYLASPAVVAASALAGYMAPPSELGLHGTLRSTASSKIRGLIEIRPMKSPLATLAALLVAAPLLAQGQSDADAQAQQPTFRTGVDVITVDVGAIDSRGQPVVDLHGPEFTVKIDGQPRRVITADLVKYNYTPDNGVTRRPAPKQQEFESLYTTNITQPEGRMIMIAVDQMNIRPGAARPILDSAARFLDKLNPADRVAFISYPEPGVVVDFTGDHQRRAPGDAESHRHAVALCRPSEHRSG